MRSWQIGEVTVTKIVEIESEVADAIAKRVPAAVLPQHQIGTADADVRRTHDFVRRMMLQHAVLVDASLMREGILADDGLVTRNLHTGDAGDEARSRVEPGRVDPSIEAEKFLAGLQGHAAATKILRQRPGAAGPIDASQPPGPLPG